MFILFSPDSSECITCGDNTSGQLGYHKEKAVRSPMTVSALTGMTVEKVACGDFFTVACTKGQAYGIYLKHYSCFVTSKYFTTKTNN